MEKALAEIDKVDWRNKPEAVVCSQLISPVLRLLGYGEHTLHKVREQQSYKLRDPTINKGSRRVKLDFEPTVYEEGLWVLEAKGTAAAVNPSTLGQVRDYAVHPEIKAALMVTVDAAGFQVYDPWDRDWDEPILTIGLDEIAKRVEELRAVLGVENVPEFVRRRHIEHLRRALSASLEFGGLDAAKGEFEELLVDARRSIEAKRRTIQVQAAQEHKELHERVLKNSGVWGVAQDLNDPWIGRVADGNDFAEAVLHQPEVQRPTQVKSVWPAIEAVYRKSSPANAHLLRPFWWLHVVVLGGCLQLRGESGCEPYATDLARQEVRNCLLGFPDDPVEAASWRLQKVLIPLISRMSAALPLDSISERTRAQLSPEDRLRYSLDPSWFFMRSVRIAALNFFRSVEPWTVENLDHQTEALAKALEEMPIPNGEWLGPLTDPWLESWADSDPLLLGGLAMLNRNESGDDFLSDRELAAVVLGAARGDHVVLRREAKPIVDRLGLKD